MISLLLVVMVVIGVPLFAVVALAALHAFSRAELEPGLVIIAFMDLGDHLQLLAVPLLCFIGVMLGHDYRQRWILSITSLAAGLRQGVNPASVALASLSVLVAACGLAMVMLVPALLYTVMASAASPRHVVGAEELVVATLGPLFVATAMLVCVPSLGERLRAVFAPAPDNSSQAARLPFRELFLPVALFAAMAVGWLSVMEVALVGVAWVAVTRMFWYRELNWQQMPAMIRRAVVTSAGILLILGLTLSWAAILHDTGVLRILGNGIAQVSGSSIIFLVLVSLLLVIGGLVLGLQVGLVLLVPLTVPVGLAVGVEPLHLGVVSMTGLLLGRGLLPVSRMLLRV